MLVRCYVYLLLKIIVPQYQPICQYNEDCPPTKLCDRLNRRCVNPCQQDDICGTNAECTPVNHAIQCNCRPGYTGNAYVECLSIQSCHADTDCESHLACIQGKCQSPCSCGPLAICDVVNHKATCKCLSGYAPNTKGTGCSPPKNVCDPNPCGIDAMCEVDRGNPVCFCPKGLTGNPFKQCSK